MICDILSNNSILTLGVKFGSEPNLDSVNGIRSDKR